MAEADAVADVETSAILLDTVEILDGLNLGDPHRTNGDGFSRERVLDLDRKTAVPNLAKGHLVEVAVRSENVPIPELHERAGFGPRHGREPS